LPRIAEGRPAAEPTSADQRARHLRILRAAEQLGTEADLDHVQMHEVARQAGVAIGTVYRYFPSKTHLFVGVMVNRIEQMGQALARRPAEDGDAADRVFDVLVRANRSLLRKPNLATAMMASWTAAKSTMAAEVARIDTAMHELLLAAAGIQDPDEQDAAVVRVLLLAWGGILQAALNGRISMPEAESGLHLACRLLMAGTSAGGRG
jgi:AcrR family transcriptional regulator